MISANTDTKLCCEHARILNADQSIWEALISYDVVLMIRCDIGASHVVPFHGGPPLLQHGLSCEGWYDKELADLNLN